LVSSGLPLHVDAQVRSTTQLAGAVNEFGVQLLKASVTATDTVGNVIVSPASVHAALSMTVNGATNETEQQMRRVLHVDSMSDAETNRQWASLLVGLDARSQEQTLAIANSLWAERDIKFKRPFIEADRDFFGAQVSTLDFENDDVAGAINGWVANNTRGMITHMIDEVPDNAILYLANAAYFKGDWVTPFSDGPPSPYGDRPPPPFRDRQPFEAPFTRADGSRVKVRMMRMTAEMPYARNGVLQATKLLYRGNATAFFVLLPKPGVSLDAAMESLEGTGFSDLRRTMQAEEATKVVLNLPRLDAESPIMSLEEPLKAMGMPLAFGLGAQFSDMVDFPDLSIGRVLHSTKVRVDEKGTEAAASTAVEHVWLMASPTPASKPPRIICDRPYLFAIADEQSGAMLFLGAVNDPRK
jgi:serpin B